MDREGFRRQGGYQHVSGTVEVFGGCSCSLQIMRLYNTFFLHLQRLLHFDPEVLAVSYANDKRKLCRREWQKKNESLSGEDVGGCRRCRKCCLDVDQLHTEWIGKASVGRAGISFFFLHLDAQHLAYACLQSPHSRCLYLVAVSAPKDQCILVRTSRRFVHRRCKVEAELVYPPSALVL